ncbi:PCNA-interacting partner isoform X1 [Astyanax mexicanus]|uniref:PCNA-interacting partner isoform X1 n=1 Tax=Astyanax mexicanus TaxID=7994 RepID=UPI0020CAE8BF|nr:PCNA-interacting partner isoform X1 [Astyanax mexicanus]
MGSVELSLKTVVRVFRRECHRVLDSERTIIHGADSMLMVLQLSAAEVCKQERGDFGVALSDVLVAWKCLLLDKLHLSHDGSPASENYDLIRKEYDSFLKRTNTVDLIDVCNAYKQLRRDEDPEDPLTAMQLFEFLHGNAEASEEAELMISQCPTTPSNRARHCRPQVRRVVRRVFCSYLGLLVNSKNDLALAHALDVPSRSLGHRAFTDLKRAARNNTTSLFLAATSFMRAVQLGGKGYAPSETDPLRKHIKGLSQFVHFTDQLEEILGEVSDPSIAACRIVSSIRAALLKGLSNEDPVYSAAEDTVKALKERISQIHTTLKEVSCGTGISPARPKAYAINHATAYGGRESVKLIMALLDEEALAPPCRNKAELLTEEQAIFNGTEGGCLLSLYKSPEAPTGISPQPLRNRIQSQQGHVKSKVKERMIRSQFACTYQEDLLPLNRVLEFPSSSQLPTCVHPAPKLPSPVPEEEPDTRVAIAEVDPGAVRAVSSALGQRSSNACPRKGSAGPRDRTAQLQSVAKTSKRKLASRECEEHGREENQPPQKRPPAKSCNPGPAKKSSKASSKKLITGQGKLTSFFRL